MSAFAWVHRSAWQSSVVGFILGWGLVACGGEAAKPAATGTQDLGTLQTGVIHVAIRGDVPFAYVKDGKLTGIDGDIMRALAEKIHYKVQPETMDFSGQLAAVSSGRVDVAIGSIGWRPARTQAGLFTDPTYYAAATIVQPQNSNLKTLADLKGKTIGTVTGYAWVPAIQKIPAKLKAYETADAVYADVTAGRIDAAFVDTIQDIYTAKVRKDLKVQTAPLQITSAQIQQDPAFVVFDQVQLAFYLPKSHQKLEAALTIALRQMYRSGELGKILQNYGLDAKLFLTPSESAKQRIGADRPTGWTPPTVGS